LSFQPHAGLEKTCGSGASMDQSPTFHTPTAFHKAWTRGRLGLRLLPRKSLRGYLFEVSSLFLSIPMAHCRSPLETVSSLPPNDICSQRYNLWVSELTYHHPPSSQHRDWCRNYDVLPVQIARHIYLKSTSTGRDRVDAGIC